MTYRFGPFRADRTTYRVFKGDQAIELTPKLLDLLFYLLERPATLVTKETLLDALWPGANVTDNALAQAISELRDALGDEPSTSVFIKTIARRGYRFVAEVRAGTDAPAVDAAPTERAAAPATFGAGGLPAIAVLDFANVTGDAEVAWLAAGIPETVTSDLASLDHFRVIDRWRVVQAARTTTGSAREIAAELGAQFIVTGSYQRSGTALRITARIVDVTAGEAVADAKVDGPIHDVFRLQDSIVSSFARELGVTLPVSPNRLGVRETSSLDAYRAYTEGLLKTESLDTELVNASIADFKRAIELDPRYAIAYTGLANAELVAYETTRLAPAQNRRALDSGIEHARQALRLDDRLAEAHGTLSFLLSSAGKFDEARAAAQRATALEPENWRHQYRLGHASWGEERLRALERAVALYPQFAFAPLEMAMVHIARGRLDLAENLVQRGVFEQDRLGRAGDRFPAAGFHWFLGLLQAARGDDETALAEFDRELANVSRTRLYGPEYAASALVARGQVQLRGGRLEQAIASFTTAHDYIEDFAAAHVGLATALARTGDAAAGHAARQHMRASIETLESSDRLQEAWVMRACDAAAHEGAGPALAWLDRLLQAGPPSYWGWTIPIEPMLQTLRNDAEYVRILTMLAARAK